MSLYPRCKLPLDLSQEQFEGLHQALDKVRSTSKSVTVDKAAMTALLLDHSRLINLLEKTNA